MAQVKAGLISRESAKAVGKLIARARVKRIDMRGTKIPRALSVFPQYVGKVKNADGTLGTDSTTSNWVYDIYAYDGTTLVAEGVPLNYTRPNGPMLAAPDNALCNFIIDGETVILKEVYIETFATAQSHCSCSLSDEVGTTYAIDGYFDGMFALDTCSATAAAPAVGSTEWDGTFTRDADLPGGVHRWAAFTDSYLPGNASGGAYHMTGKRLFATDASAGLDNFIYHYPESPVVEGGSPVAACWYVNLVWWVSASFGCIAWRGYKVGGDTPAGTYTYISGSASALTTIDIV